MDVLMAYPVRKSRRQKEAFRHDAVSYYESLGYACRVERGVLGVRNVVVGDPEKTNILITAHYDTCAWLPFPNFIAPCNLFVFLFYQVVLISLMFGFALLVGVGALVFSRSATVAICFMDIVLWALIALMLFGPANRHNANDNTSGVAAIFEIARNLPEDLRDQVCFVLFDLEEAGLIGSISYYVRHRKTSKRQVVFNLDCVGEGDDFVFFPKKRILKDARLGGWLREATAVGLVSGKRVTLREKGFSYFPSDQAVFPYGVGVGAFKKSKLGFLYLGKVHTKRDRILDEKNVVFLSQFIVELLETQPGANESVS